MMVFGLVTANTGCKTDAACHDTDACAFYGLCTARGTKCVVGEGDCAASVICRNEGLCTAVEGRCRAVEDDDCKRSEGCRHEGKCRAVGTGCVR